MTSLENSAWLRLKRWDYSTKPGSNFIPHLCFMLHIVSFSFRPPAHSSMLADAPEVHSILEYSNKLSFLVKKSYRIDFSKSFSTLTT
jgi:hypothetical protein